MTAEKIIKKIKIILEYEDASDDEKVEEISLWAKRPNKVIEMPRTILLMEELKQYQIPHYTFNKIQNQVLPFLDTVGKMKGTRNTVYYYHYLPFWIFFKDKGYMDSTTAIYISNLASKKWPKTKMPNIKGTIRMFNKLTKQLNGKNQKK